MGDLIHPIKLSHFTIKRNRIKQSVEGDSK